MSSAGDDTGRAQDEIARRLEELGVPSSAAELDELASAYPALVEWMRIAEKLGARPVGETGETEQRS